MPPGNLDGWLALHRLPGLRPAIRTVDRAGAVSYSVYMSTTITIRAEESLRKALARKAAASGKTISELVREILEEALADRPMRVRAGHLKGRLDLSRKSSEPWRKRLRERNWRS